MAENIDVKATLTADDKASPTIRRILNQIAALEKQLKAFGKTGFAAANKGTIVTKEAQKYLDRYGESLKKIPQNYLREARRMRQAGEMTNKAWVDLNNEIKAFDKHIKRANKSGSELSKQQKRHFYDLINRAKAYQYVWNQGHEQRMSLERRLHNEQLRMADARARQEGRTTAQWLKTQRYRRQLRIAEQRREEAEARAAEKLRLQHVERQLRDAEERRKLRAKLAKETDAQARRDLQMQLYRLRVRENSEKLQRRQLSEQLKVLRNKDRLRANYDKEVAKQQRREDIARRTRVNEQLREAEARRRARLREFQQEQDMRRQARREALRSARQMVGAPGRMASRLENPFFSSPYFYAMMAGGAGVMAARSMTRSALSVDRGETFARMHMDQSIVPASEVRKWALATAPGMGITPGALIETTVDAAKAGVPEEMAQSTAQMVTQLAKFFGIDVAQAMDGVGYAIAQEIGAGRMKADDDTSLRRLLNTGALLAGKTAARPDQMLSFMRTGLGSGAMLGMNQTATMAFGAAAVQAGAQGQQAARMLGSMAGDINQIETRAKDLRKQGRQSWSTTDKLFMDAPRLLGYASHGAIMQSFRDNPETAMVDFLKSFNRIEDFNIRDQLFRSIFGNEFGRFSANLISSPGVLDRSLQIAREGYSQDPRTDHINKTWSEYTKGLEFLADGIGSLTEVIKSELGDSLKPFIAQFSTWAKSWHMAVGTGGIKARFDAGLQGLMRGFGYDTLGQMLHDAFGAPGAFDVAELQKFFDFAKGFAEGLKVVGKTIMAFMEGLGKALGVDASTPEGLGKLTAMLLGFSVALHFARPIFSVIGIVKDGIIGLAGSIVLLHKALMAAGLAGGFAGIGRALLGRAGLAVGAGLLGTLGAGAVGLTVALAGVALVGGALAVAIMNWDTIKGWWQSADAAVQRGGATVRGWFGDHRTTDEIRAEARKQAEEAAKMPTGWQILTGWIKGLLGISSANAGELDPLIGGSGSNGLKGGLGSDLITSMDDLTRSVDKLGARLQLSSLTSPRALSGLNGSSAAASGGYISGGGGGGGTVAGRYYHSTPGEALPGAVGGDLGPVAPHTGPKTFTGIGARLMTDLQKDFGFTKEQAAGIVGNLAHESAGFTAFQEKNPIGGGKGGWGYAQWTGPRRRAFFQWAQERGLDPRSYEANYGFLRHELTNTPEKKAVAAVKRQNSAYGSMMTFEQTFERAGIKHYASRGQWTQRAMQLPDNLAGGVPDAASLTQNVPLPPARPATGAGGSGGAGAGMSLNAPITIYGAGQSPEEIANAVQRRLHEQRTWATHDVEHDV